VGKAAYRRDLVKQHSARLCCAYLHASCGDGESTTDLVFGGHDLIAEDGILLAEQRFATGLLATEIDVQKLEQERRRTQMFTPCTLQTVEFDMTMEETVLTRPVSDAPFVPQDSVERDEVCEEILTVAALGLKRRLEHTGSKTAVIGLSGGLDSTLALLIVRRAFDLLKRDRKEILAVTMPCFGTTDRTRSNAELLAQCCGCSFKTVTIGDTVRSHFNDIGQSMDCHDVTFENGQARERTQVLMDLANMTGGLVIGTGDLSELTLGWATYNGDHMSMYGVNGSIPKTLMRHLVAYTAANTTDRELSRVLLDILDTPVSPELLPAVDGEIAQKTEDLVGPYDLHDFFLYHMVRWACPPAKILRLAQYAFGSRFDRQTILKWLKTFCRRFFAQQFKRSCLPDGPKVGSVSLSPRGDWQMPSDAVWTLWQQELEKL
jgi:NAD+ synthase (glutamine-hydrolysing)